MRKKHAALTAFLMGIVALLFNELLWNSAEQKTTRDTAAQQDEQKKQEENQVDDGLREQATLVRVVDGDTIVVAIEEKQEIVRLIGINTPETVDPRSPVECFGKEASQALREKIGPGDGVVLSADESQAKRDRYGRLLRYVEKEEEDIGEWLIKNGYAQEYTYKMPYSRQDEYKKSEQFAREEGRGLWSNVCR